MKSQKVGRVSVDKLVFIDLFYKVTIVSIQVFKFCECLREISNRLVLLLCLFEHLSDLLGLFIHLSL